MPFCRPRAKDPLEGVHTVVQKDENGLYIVGVDGSNGNWWCPDLRSVTDVAWSKDASQLAVMKQTPKIDHHELRSFVNVCSASGSRQIAEISNRAADIAWAEDEPTALISWLLFTSTSAIALTAMWTVLATSP